MLLPVLLAGGCSLSSDSQQDDEKETHFMVGKGRVNAMDYAGAVQAFKESLEANPRSAAAHYQLAWIYENKLTNAAAAIYHYQEYLELDPKVKNRDLINQRIYSCKQQLVADVMQMPTAPAVQVQLERMAQQNHKMQDELDKWHAYYAAQLTAQNNAAGNPGAAPAGNGAAPGAGAPSLGTTQGLPVRAPTTPNGPAGGVQPPIHLHTHVVASGETLAAIARKAHVTVSAIQALNPGLNPRHLRTGQPLNLP